MTRRRLTNNTILQWGTWRGYRMKDIPASYLLAQENTFQCTNEFRQYVKVNREALEKEVQDLKNVDWYENVMSKIEDCAVDFVNERFPEKSKRNQDKLAKIFEDFAYLLLNSREDDKEETT